MGLPWVRLDSNIGQNDKILALLDDPSPKKWQAFSSYVCALGWSAQHETDGKVPVRALPFVHGTATTARLLVKYGLWREASVTGYEIHNYDHRQMTVKAAKAKQAMQSAGGLKGNCKRWHLPGCECWKTGGEPHDRVG